MQTPTPRPQAGTIMVGVLLGGRSSEREVSLSSGRQVYYNLDRARYRGQAIYMDLAGRLWAIPEKLLIQNTCADVDARLEADATRLPYEDLPQAVDLVFNTLHGKYGDDGCIQGLLELLDLPYTGSGVLACALSLDKPMAHRMLAASGLEAPHAVLLDSDDWSRDQAGCLDRVERELMAGGEGAVVVLPAREGSSVGVAVVGVSVPRVSVPRASVPRVSVPRVSVPEPAGLTTGLSNSAGSPLAAPLASIREELAAAINDAFAYDRRVLVEAFLAGMEFSVIVTGNDDRTEAFLPTETRTENPFMTYDDKYMPGRSQKITPAEVDEATVLRLQSEALRVYRALGFQGYGRLDGFLLPDGQLVFTDPNSTSGMSPSSYMFHQAAEAGLTATALIDRLLRLALEAHAAKRGPL